MDKAEADLSRGKSKPKPQGIAAARQRVLDAVLDDGKAREEAPSGRFRDPALSVTRKR